MPSSHLILCRPLLLLPPISPSIRVFSNESTLCMRLNYPPGRLQKIPLVCQSRGQEGVDYLRKYSVSGVWKMNSTPDLGTHWSLVLSNCWVGIFASYCCSVAKSCQTFCNPMNCSTSGFLVFNHLLELTQTHVHWVDNVVQPSHPLSPLSPPALNLSQHQGFLPKSQFFKSGGQSIGALASASVLPMKIQGWFRINWFDLLAVQGTPKSLLQHHSSKASVFQHSAFFMVQLSHWYMTTGKTIALTRWTFINKVISLLFNSVYVGYSFLSKEQVSFNFMATFTVCSDFGAQENSLSLFPFFPIYLPWSDGTGCHDLNFLNVEF